MRTKEAQVRRVHQALASLDVERASLHTRAIHDENGVELRYGDSVLLAWANGIEKAISEVRQALELTDEELAESVEAAEHDGGAGVIEVDGRHCYALGG